jgi:hypothetical protein
MCDAINGNSGLSARLEMPENSTSPLLYPAILKAKVEAAVAMATAVKNAPPPASTVHTGVQGQIREILVRELFRPLLPPDFGVGTGQLIDGCSNLSPETDIILFDRRLAPPMMLNESLGFFPIESCLFIVEVKTTLNPAELKNSHKAALRIKELDVNNLSSLPNERQDKSKYEFIRYVLFAFSSNIRRQPECLRYQTYYRKRPSEEWATRFGPPIRAFCVVGKEYSHVHGANGKEEWTGVHKSGKGGEAHACTEVITFVGGIIKGCRSISSTRRPIWMEDYAFPNITFGTLAPALKDEQEQKGPNR